MRYELPSKYKRNLFSIFLIKASDEKEEQESNIRSNIASVPVRWRAGVNTIRAEITNNEFFGWGLCIKTGLSDMSFITEEKY